jgi:rubredoxin
MKPFPTVEQIQSFDGGKNQKRWDHIRHDWSCPSCKRTKKQIIHINDWGNLSWQVDKHHDHGTDYSIPQRFYPTFLCQSCNNADALAKRELELPYYFSFTPWEIAQFVKAEPHQKHELDFKIAKVIFDKIAAGKWSEEVKKWKDEEGKTIEWVKKELDTFFTPKPPEVIDEIHRKFCSCILCKRVIRTFRRTPNR